MMRDEARMIARGAVFHAMWIKVYDVEPQWEEGVFVKVASFLKTQDLGKKVKLVKPNIALYQPTWGTAALKGRSAKQPFIPRTGHSVFVTKMVGLMESFGLPYRLIMEADLVDPSRLRDYEHIVVPLWDFMPRVIGESKFEALKKDRRVIGISLHENALTRGEFGEILEKAGVKTFLDYGTGRIVAGRTANLIYNWDDQPIRVQVPERKDEVELGSHGYMFLE
jgi:hypothetical protein